MIIYTIITDGMCAILKNQDSLLLKTVNFKTFEENFNDLLGFHNVGKNFVALLNKNKNNQLAVV